MRRRQNLTGQRFGSLTVIEASSRLGTNTNSQWVCRCDCGRYLIVRADNLKTGHSTRCSICSNRGGVPSIFIERGVEDRDGVI